MEVAIYARTSTVEQVPENQLADCRSYCIARGYHIEGEYLEQLSGFKDIVRPVYEMVKEKAKAGKIQGVVVWALDRWVRNRDTLLEDVTTLRSYGCEIHSVKEAWLEAINIAGPLGKTLQDFLLGLVGSLAEMESQLHSERTKIAYLNRKQPWGRRCLPARVISDVLLHREAGKSIRWIARNVTYTDKNNNKKCLSVGSVHKIIAMNPLKS